MKYTIEGFSQKAALSLKKEVKIIKDEKEYIQTLKLDITDLILLRWFVDFYPKMKKKIVNEVQYAWVNYQSIVDDLPLLSIEKKQVYRRFKKMCDLEILTHHHEKDGGSFSYYSFGKKYSMLIETPEPSQKDTPRTSESHPLGHLSPTPRTSESYPLGLQSPNKDSSIINNSSIIDNKESKKERKKKEQPKQIHTDKKENKENNTCRKTYDQIIEEYTDNEVLRNELKENLKTRKMKKALPTNHGLLSDLKDLDSISLSTLEKIEIVKKSNERGWASFYPLNEYDSNHRLSFDKLKEYDC